MPVSVKDKEKGFDGASTLTSNTKTSVSLMVIVGSEADTKLLARSAPVTK